MTCNIDFLLYERRWIGLLHVPETVETGAVPFMMFVLAPVPILEPICTSKSIRETLASIVSASTRYAILLCLTELACQTC